MPVRCALARARERCDGLGWDGAEWGEGVVLTAFGDPGTGDHREHLLPRQRHWSDAIPGTAAVGRVSALAVAIDDAVVLDAERAGEQLDPHAEWAVVVDLKAPSGGSHG